MTKYVHTFQNFVSKEAFSGILLFVTAVLALIIANSSFAQEYYDLWHLPFGMTLGTHEISMTLSMWINDGLMALFFLMVGLEIKREMLIGELSSLQKASFPIVAAIGGMLIPALVYVGLNPNNPIGFGVPMATDIAFALGILLLLGNKVSHSLKLFLVALAVVDDLGAVLVVATVYTNEIHAGYFLHAILIYAIIWILNFKGVKSLWPYLILGIALWVYIHAIGIHATIAGVLLAFAIPISSKIEEKQFIANSKKAIDEFEKHIDNIPILNHHQIDALENVAHGYDKVQNPLVKLEHQLHSFSAFFIMPLFAFANAGVPIDFSGVSQHLMVVLGVIFGLILGKPIGVLGFTYLASKMGFIQKPNNLSWEEIIAVGFLAGIGFTMSIFITNLAFVDETLIDAVKLGIFLASFIAGVIGVLLINRAAKAKQIKKENT